MRRYEKMKILKINENPYGKNRVSKLPKDAKHKQYDMNGNEIFYSNYTKKYYVVIK
jgi:hypothetical protein